MNPKGTSQATAVAKMQKTDTGPASGGDESQASDSDATQCKVEIKQRNEIKRKACEKSQIKAKGWEAGHQSAIGLEKYAPMDTKAAAEMDTKESLIETLTAKVKHQAKSNKAMEKRLNQQAVVTKHKQRSGADEMSTTVSKRAKEQQVPVICLQ